MPKKKPQDSPKPPSPTGGQAAAAPALAPALVSTFIEDNCTQAGRFVAARLQAAMALLERLRDFPSLILIKHLCNPGSASINSHEPYGDKALLRFSLQAINKNHGRRSSNLPVWGQGLLDTLAAQGFAEATPEAKGQIINEAQSTFAAALRTIIEQDPLEAHLRSRTAEAVIADILSAAEKKGKCGDVAQYLVGAKLELRLGRPMPVYPANKSDRTSLFDPAPRLGDFEIENTVIEVAVGRVDDKHIEQIEEILEKSDAEVRLLTRASRVSAWQDDLNTLEDVDIKRVAVTSVEAFVGQNIAELGGFAAKGKADQLAALFNLYNTRWVAKVGTPGIRIVIK